MESLRYEKGFQKTAKKQQKDLESLRKKHMKEKNAMQKSQCNAIEKLIKNRKYELKLLKYVFIIRFFAFFILR